MDRAKSRKKNPRARIIGILLLILLAAMVLTVTVNIAINRSFTVSFYSIRCDKVSDNIRIIELADLHNNEFGQNNEKLVNQIKALHPDLIVYAGDMMTYQNDDYSVLFNLSDRLGEIAPNSALCKSASSTIRMLSVTLSERTE